MNEDSTITIQNETVAVLLAVYNGEKYINQQLSSLEQQTYRDFICYIHDDGSDDETQNLAAKFCKAHPERFIYLGSSRTGGAKYNFMYMLRQIDADYIMFCDQDDVWLSEKIEKTFQVMRDAEYDKKEVPTAVHTDVLVTDANLNVISPSFYTYTGRDASRNSFKDIMFSAVAVGCTMMINRSLRQVALQADVTDLIYMHDWYLALLARGLGNLVYINEPLMYYRQHGDNVSAPQKADERRTFFRYINYLGSPKTYLNKKRASFLRMRQMSEALLMIYEKEAVDEDDSGLRILRETKRACSGSLVRGMIYYYRWRFGK